MRFGIQRQFDHPFKKFVRRQPRKILLNEFFAKQAANIAQLAAFLFAGKNKLQGVLDIQPANLIQVNQM